MGAKFRSLPCTIFLGIVSSALAIIGIFEMVTATQASKITSFFMIAALVFALLFWATLSKPANETKKQH